MELEQLTQKVIGCAITVHKTLGPGFIESIYEKALILELRKNDFFVQTQEECNVYYLDTKVGTHRYDLLVEKELLIELKAVSTLHDIDFSRTRKHFNCATHCC